MTLAIRSLANKVPGWSALLELWLLVVGVTGLGVWKGIV
jgi:hypothetical protein